PHRPVTLPFPHIGFPAGATFTSALADGRLQISHRRRLWRPFRSPLPRRGMAQSARRPYGRTTAILAGLLWPVVAYPAARPPPASCQGVRTLGPSAVMATVNSKWADSEPSWL